MIFGNCKPTQYESFCRVINPPGMKHKAGTVFLYCRVFQFGHLKEPLVTGVVCITTDIYHYADEND
jgi:hypothetical protein